MNKNNIALIGILLTLLALGSCGGGGGGGGGDSSGSGGSGSGLVASVTEGVAPLSVDFTITGTLTAYGSQYGHIFYLGDGAAKVASGIDPKNINYEFSRPGIYSVFATDFKSQKIFGPLQITVTGTVLTSDDIGPVGTTTGETMMRYVGEHGRIAILTSNRRIIALDADAGATPYLAVNIDDLGLPVDSNSCATSSVPTADQMKMYVNYIFPDSAGNIYLVGQRYLACNYLNNFQYVGVVAKISAAGVLLWSQDLVPAGRSASDKTPTVVTWGYADSENNAVYVNWDTSLQQLDMTTGTPGWLQAFHSVWHVADGLVDDSGNFYIGEQTGKVSSIAVASGSVNWSADIGYYGFETFAINADGNPVTFKANPATYDYDQLQALIDASTGAIIYHRDAGTGIRPTDILTASGGGSSKARGHMLVNGAGFATCKTQGFSYHNVSFHIPWVKDETSLAFGGSHVFIGDGISAARSHNEFSLVPDGVMVGGGRCDAMTVSSGGKVMVLEHLTVPPSGAGPVNGEAVPYVVSMTEKEDTACRPTSTIEIGTIAGNAPLMATVSAVDASTDCTSTTASHQWEVYDRNGNKLYTYNGADQTIPLTAPSSLQVGGDAYYQIVLKSVEPDGSMSADGITARVTPTTTSGGGGSGGGGGGSTGPFWSTGTMLYAQAVSFCSAGGGYLVSSATLAAHFTSGNFPFADKTDPFWSNTQGALPQSHEGVNGNGFITSYYDTAAYSQLYAYCFR